MPAKALNTSRVDSGTPGLTRTAGSAGSATGADRISPTPRMMRALEARQTGTSAPVASAAAASAGWSAGMPLTRARSRSAAAASAEPPPMPAATGKFFSSRKCPPLRPGTRRAQGGFGLQHQIVGIGPAGRGIAAGDGETGVRARLQRERVGDAGKDDQAFQLMIAVGAPADDAQGQVDLGRSLFGERRGHARRISRRRRPSSPPWPATTAPRRGRSSAWPRTLISSSGSGFMSRACAHWKRASSLRPTRQ